MNKYFANAWGNNGDEKYDIKPSLTNSSDPDSPCGRLLSKLRVLEERVKKAAVDSAEKWFKKKLSAEVIESFFCSPVKASTEPDKYPPGLKINVPFRNAKVDADVFGPDNNEDKLDWEDLRAASSGASIVTIVDVSSLWFMNSQFGYTMRLIQAKLGSHDKISGFAIVEDPDDTENDVAGAAGVKRKREDGGGDYPSHAVELPPAGLLEG